MARIDGGLVFPGRGAQLRKTNAMQPVIVTLRIR